MLSKNRLLFDLYVAYEKAKKHKSSKHCILEFEKNLKSNIERIADELLSHSYKPHPSNRFVIYDPKIREIYAADFSDRIVHHLYYEYTHEIFEDTFIHETYSCIKGRGTHFGINRLRHHIESESNNYIKKCYVLKLDIRGYFMHINRNILLKIATETIRKFAHKLNVDLDFIMYLTKEIILYNPTIDCNNISTDEEFCKVPYGKSLKDSPPDCGLPIGNLTSQLFSNVYMNVFDQFIKRSLRCKHYGRYVDDAYVVSCDRQFLRDIVPKIERFLKKKLHLQLHRGKTQICDIRYGVEFIGAYIKPHRMYASNQSVGRMEYRMNSRDKSKPKEHHLASMISHSGILSHYKAFNTRKRLIQKYL